MSISMPTKPCRSAPEGTRYDRVLAADSPEIDAPEIDTLRATARMIARAEVSDVLTQALTEDGRGLREIARNSGLDAGFISKLAQGSVNKQGATVASLAQIALALNKTLKISIE